MGADARLRRHGHDVAPSSSRTTSRSSGSRCARTRGTSSAGSWSSSLVALNIVGVQEAAKLNVFLAVVDFATQLLLVLLGFVLVLDPQILVDNVHWGVAPTWSNLALAVPVAMLAYTGVETVSNLAEEVRDPVRSVPNAYKLVAVAVFAIYFTLPWSRSRRCRSSSSTASTRRRSALPPEEGGYANDPVLGLVAEPRLDSGRC